MKQAIWGIVAAMLVVVVGACANSEQSVFLEKFIPWSPAESCKVTPETKLWYDTGYVDVYFTDEYWLPFKIVNEMVTSAATGQGVEGATYDTAEANYWTLKKVILWYELPPVPGVDESVWRRREVVSGVKVDNAGGMISGFVQILTWQMVDNLRAIFALFMANNAAFDWDTYPIIVTMQAEGIKQGGGDVIRTNKLNFKLVPLYGERVRVGAIYPDKGWPTDEEIEAQYPPSEWEQQKYERDKDKYDTIVTFCDFSSDHLVGGCAPGQDYGLVDCYTAFGYDAAIEALFPEWNCCPVERPDEPQEPEQGT